MSSLRSGQCHRDSLSEYFQQHVDSLRYMLNALRAQVRCVSQNNFSRFEEDVDGIAVITVRQQAIIPEHVDIGEPVVGLCHQTFEGGRGFPNCDVLRYKMLLYGSNQDVIPA